MKKPEIVTFAPSKVFIILLALLVIACADKTGNNNENTQAATENAEPSLSNLKNEEATPEVGVLEMAAQIDSLQTFVMAAAAINLEEILDEAEGQFTVFAPTNQAFRDAGIALSREDTYENETLKDFILQHIISQHSSSEFWKNEIMYNTMNGGEITIHLKDEVAYVNEAKIVATDIEGKGGVIHIINKVIAPNPEKSGTSVQ